MGFLLFGTFVCGHLLATAANGVELASLVGNESTVVRIRPNGGSGEAGVTILTSSLEDLRVRVRESLSDVALMRLGKSFWFACPNGFDVNSWEALLRIPPSVHGDRELYAVPSGRYFQWSAAKVHERIPVKMNDWKGVELETVSLHPRIFVVHGLFTQNEADKLVNNSLEATGVNKLARSGTGFVPVGEDLTEDPDINDERTSDNSWDMESAVATALSERMFQLVRIPYDDGKADGLQVLRYREKEAYTTHEDWFDPSQDIGSEGESLDTTHLNGTNRFVTVILYLRSPTAGGATVFPEAIIETGLKDTEFVSSGRDVEAKSSARGHIERLWPNGGWESVIAHNCSESLAVKPVALKAVLFYHQDPLTGELLSKTSHAGCPTFGGVKWAANMWIWNNKRAVGSHGGEDASHSDGEIEVEFQNTMGVRTALEYSLDEGFTWSHARSLEPDESVGMTSYISHLWRFIVEDQEVQRWEVTDYGLRLADGSLEDFAEDDALDEEEPHYDDEDEVAGKALDEL
eukprot:TRINITY_DN8973_c0_g1_i1.p1 TRINITY_DN8973_c0_g1~~TRINITY_DN8973_c0_g1_i1.p1  ORF type:complete len:518 (+),score=88.05 TRINITY_DN8973_c0_g1_i1:38-1591(+)